MKVKSPAPKLGTLQAALAQRVANIAFPQAASSVFDQLKEAQGDNSVDPRKQFRSTVPSLGMPTPEGSQTLMQKRINGAQTHAKPEEQTGGGGKYSGKNTKYVDDQGWGVNLNQILGSGLLSPEQLKRASIQNVSQMFNVTGAKSPEEKQEIYFMFQRMMLEGFIRGVDITKDIPKQSRFSVNITDGSVPGASNSNVIGNATQRGINLKGSFWRSKDDAQKLALFYHEIGHELMNKRHEGSGMMKSGGGLTTAKTIKSSRDAYNRYMNDFFDSSSSRGFNHLKTPVQKHSDPKYDPSWFPAATGVDTGYTPGGTEVGDSYQTTNNTYNTYVPPTIGAAGGVAQAGMQPLTSSSPRPSGPSAGPMSGGADEQVAAPSASDFSSNVQSMAETGSTAGPALQSFGNITNRAG